MNLQELLHKHRVPVRESGSHRHVTEGWIGVDCPWCSEKGAGKFHLGIEPATRRVSCWRCGGHRLGDTVARLTGLPLSQVLSLLDDLPLSPRMDSKGPLPRGELEYPKGLEPLLEPQQGYLERRGFDPIRLTRVWGIKGLGPTPPLGWRVWIPFHLDGEVVSWTTRTIGNGEPKYVNARPEQEALPIKSLLYGWDFVRGTTIVVEGPTDVWRIGPGAVAVSGLLVSDEQLSLLARVPKRFVCFDSEPNAQRRAERLCRSLSSLPGETHRVELLAGDPGEAEVDEIEELRNLLK